MYALQSAISEQVFAGVRSSPALLGAPAVLATKTADFQAKSQEAEAAAAKVKELNTALIEANSGLEDMKKTENQLKDLLKQAKVELTAGLDEIVSHFSY